MFSCVVFHMFVTSDGGCESDFHSALLAAENIFKYIWKARQNAIGKIHSKLSLKHIYWY